MLLYTIMTEKRIGKSKKAGKDDHGHCHTHLDEDGRALWTSVTKDITPLQTKKCKTSAQRPAQQKPPTMSKKILRGQDSTTTKMVALHVDVSLKHPPASKKTAQAGSQMSTQQKKRLMAGNLPIEGKIDLHGKTLEAAFRSLKSFLLRAYAAEKRGLLIITGKGRVRQDGQTIRQSLPSWVQNDADIAPLILSLTPAQPKDGGDGAWYILLRRQKFPNHKKN